MDHKFAILPKDLANLTSFIKLRDNMLLNLGKDHQQCEQDSRENYTGRFNG